jgi:hypothetical protein
MNMKRKLKKLSAAQLKALDRALNPSTVLRDLIDRKLDDALRGQGTKRSPRVKPETKATRLARLNAVLSMQARPTIINVHNARDELMMRIGLIAARIEIGTHAPRPRDERHHDASPPSSTPHTSGIPAVSTNDAEPIDVVPKPDNKRDNVVPLRAYAKAFGVGEERHYIGGELPEFPGTHGR